MLRSFREEARSIAGVAMGRARLGGQEEPLRSLLEAFPDEARSVAGREFAEACRNQHVGVAKLLLRVFPHEVVEVVGQADDNDGTTPLHWICRLGLTPLLRPLLMEFPKEVETALKIVDPAGRAPLALACERGHNDLVRLALKRLPLSETIAPQPPLARHAAEGYAAKPEMIASNEAREALEQQDYSLVGSHSAVKQCRWTQNALRGEGQCYKHTFYGISSHRCMNATPSLACANKCTFCWRNHANPVATSWDFAVDDPEWIVEESIQRHAELINHSALSPLALPERVAEARAPRHVALSLVGEPVLYPEVAAMVQALHERRISTFLVTNGQFPEQLEGLPQVTQLYVSVDAPSAEDLRRVDRPLFKDHWQRLRRSLAVLREKRPAQRTVCRMTLLKGINMHEASCESYAELFRLSDCDFVEVKGGTWSANMESEGLSLANVPTHEDVCAFAENLAAALPEYGIASAHAHSCAVLLARRDRFLQPTGRWRTWIDFDRFAEAAAEGTPLDVEEFTSETPEWAVTSSTQELSWGHGGFDPAEERRRRRPSARWRERQAVAGEGAVARKAWP